MTGDSWKGKGDYLLMKAEAQRWGEDLLTACSGHSLPVFSLPACLRSSRGFLLLGGMILNV